jgi:CheY-like chemotaxis protein
MHPSILITDDDRGFRETLRGVFEPEGFQTLLAEDGAQAIDIVRSFDVHLLLLDMHMPRLTGLETLRLSSSSRGCLAFCSPLIPTRGLSNKRCGPTPFRF